MAMTILFPWLKRGNMRRLIHGKNDAPLYGEYVAQGLIFSLSWHHERPRGSRP
jgi:hypothetical protein